MSQITRTRVCDNPPSANGGQPCPADVDDDVQSKDCNGGIPRCINHTKCSFDIHFCHGWDFGGWKIQSGPTDSYDTGPTTGFAGTVVNSLDIP